MTDKEFVDFMEGTMHECAPGHSVQAITLSDLRRLIAIARAASPGHRWRIERTVKAVGEREF